MHKDQKLNLQFTSSDVIESTSTKNRTRTIILRKNLSLLHERTRLFCLKIFCLEKTISSPEGISFFLVNYKMNFKINILSFLSLI